ncbi:DUF1186 domain-containing protein [Endozoicomonas sp. SCSIO W0465]|nr:DUF1186 domain-containing protein [Endozoicomonas sp. SCSIO W0465]USE37575.1 DUF1186 domain-containing protein [Endozoicomonas sp. SCSIO W0465]
MNIDDVINRLSNHVVGELPGEALLAASEQRIELIPRLLEYLEVVAGQGDEIPEEQRVDLVFFAFYLLAQFRESKALPVMLQIVSANPRTVNRLLGYVVSESLARILASVMAGEDNSGGGIGNRGHVEPLKRLIENTAVHPHVRSSCLTCLTILVFHGFLSREALVSYFEQLFNGGLEQQRNPVWDGLVSNCIIAGAAGLEAAVLEVFDKGLLTDSFMGRERLSTMLQEHSGDLRFPSYESFALIDDCVAELQGWASFTSSRPKEKPTERVTVGSNAEPAAVQRVTRPWPARKPNPHVKRPALPQWLSDQQRPFSSNSPNNHKQPLVRQHPKVGRNDPCPCGSGRKYKKCCG